MKNSKIIEKCCSFGFKSLLAGIAIGFGCVANVLYCPDNKIIGSFLFSLALLTVCMQRMNLFTGKIGYMNSFKDAALLIVMLILNCFGIYIFSKVMLMTTLDFSNVYNIVNAKMSSSDISSFILAICCGVMMYFAVENFRQIQNPLFIIMPIMCFILCGFEHCIANMGYFALANTPMDMQWLSKMGLFILGNAVGSLLYSKLNFSVNIIK